MFAYCRNNPVTRKDADGKDDEEAVIEGQKQLDALLEEYAVVDKDGFEIELSEDVDAWDMAIKAVGIQEAYTYIADQLCSAYEIKYGEEFLFSNDCVAYEIEYHVDAYMCATNHDGYSRNITTYLYTYESLKKHCHKIDIKTGDVFDWKQRFIFGYRSGIREIYQYTSKDPFYVSSSVTIFGSNITCYYRSLIPRRK